MGAILTSMARFSLGATVSRTVIACALLLPSLTASTQDLQHLGSFHNVTSQDRGEHCSGYSLGLWKYRDELLGLLDVHAGLCGDPPCAAIRGATLDAKSGRLEFSASIDGQTIQFEGTMTRAAIVGLFNGRRARLARDTQGTDEEFEPNRSLRAWCRFWGSVPRCRGVRELCELTLH